MDIEDPISAEEQELADLFYQSLGRAIGRWSILEFYLGLMFAKATNMEEVVSRNVFHSARSWRGRYDMLSGALSASASTPGVISAWRCILTRCNDYAAFRNIIAHDHVQLGLPQIDGNRYLTIRPAKASLFEADGMGHRQPEIATAASNFQLMAAVVAAAILWDGVDSVGSPERSCWLIDQLPNQPHSKRLDPILAKQFSLGLATQAFPR